MRLTKSNSLIKVVFLGLVSLVLGGCEGFMDGGLQKKELDEALQYNKSAYAKVEISANASAVKTLVPAANLYDSSYKKNDKIELKFEPKPSYQFLYWTAEPAGSVVFDSITDLNTNAKIVSNTNSTIVITPKTVVRPIVTVSPDSTGGAKPKNTSIYINFNHPIDLTEEELANCYEELNISIDGESVRSYYEEPVLINNATQIYYAPSSTNHYSFKSGTRTVKVTVPSDFYYLEGDTKIYMAEAYTSTFVINNTTVESATITIPGNIQNAAASVNGNIQIFTNETQSVVFTLAEHCSFDSWNISSQNGTLTKDNEFIYMDGVKVLRYTEPDSATAQELLKSNKIEITFEALAEASGIEIYPVVIVHPYVVSVSPDFSLSGVPCDTNVTVTFSEAISLESFRFSDEELALISYDELYRDNAGLCYGYLKDGIVYYKNIRLENLVTGAFLNTNYSIPVLSDDKTLVLEPLYDNLLVGKGSDSLITVKLSLNTDGTIKNDDGIVLSGGESTYQFKYNSSRESEAPVIHDLILARKDRLLQIAKDASVDAREDIFTDKFYTEWTESDYLTNMASTIYGYIKGFEANSLIYKVKVEETLLYKVENTIVTEIEKPLTLSGYAEGSFSQVQGEKSLWEGDFKYTLQNADDGIVKIELTIEDYYGNGTSYTYYVNKDTKITSGDFLILSQNSLLVYGSESLNKSTTNDNDALKLWQNLNSDSSLDVDQLYNGFNSIFWISDLQDNYYTPYGSKYTYLDEFEYEVRWSDSKEGLIEDYNTSGRLTASDSTFYYLLWRSKTSLPWYPTHAQNGYKIESLDPDKDYYIQILAYDQSDGCRVCEGVKYKSVKIISSEFDGTNFTCSVQPNNDLPDNYTEKYQLWYAYADNYGEKKYRKAGLFNTSNISCSITDSFYDDKLEFVIQTLVYYDAEFYDQNIEGWEQKYISAISPVCKVTVDSQLTEEASLGVSEPSVTLSSSGPNTGLYTLKFTVDNNNYDKLYVISDISQPGDAVSNLFESDSNVLEFKVDADLLYGETYNYTIVAVKGNSKQTISATVDTSSVSYNKAPVIDVSYFTLTYNGDYLLLNTPKSKSSINEANMKCYYTEVSYGSPWYDSYAESHADYGINVTKNNKITESDIRSFESLPVTYYSQTDKSKIKIPVKELKNKTYLICLDVTDESNNNVCSSAVYLYRGYFYERHDLTIDDAYIYYAPYQTKPEYYHSANFRGTLKYYNESTDKLQTVFDNVIIEFPKENVSSGSTKYKAFYNSTRFDGQYVPSSTKTNGNYNKFYKYYSHGNSAARLMSFNGLGTMQYYPLTDDYGAIIQGYVSDGHSHTSYYAQNSVPSYFYASGSTFSNAGVTCNSKEMSEGLQAALLYFMKDNTVTGLTGEDEITVKIDKPCLIQTMVSSVDWTAVGQQESKDAVALWEQHTFEDNIQNIQVIRPATEGTADLKLYRIDKSAIPSGMYYCVIAHFADGTSAISSVHQK